MSDMSGLTLNKYHFLREITLKRREMPLKSAARMKTKLMTFTKLPGS